MPNKKELSYSIQLLLSPNDYTDQFRALTDIYEITYNMSEDDKTALESQWQEYLPFNERVKLKRRITLLEHVISNKKTDATNPLARSYLDELNQATGLLKNLLENIGTSVDEKDKNVRTSTISNLFIKMINDTVEESNQKEINWEKMILNLYQLTNYITTAYYGVEKQLLADTLAHQIFPLISFLTEEQKSNIRKLLSKGKLDNLMNIIWVNESMCYNAHYRNNPEKSEMLDKMSLLINIFSVIVKQPDEEFDKKLGEVGKKLKKNKEAILEKKINNVFLLIDNRTKKAVRYLQGNIDSLDKISDLLVQYKKKGEVVHAQQLLEIAKDPNETVRQRIENIQTKVANQAESNGDKTGFLRQIDAACLHFFSRVGNALKSVWRGYFYKPSKAASTALWEKAKNPEISAEKRKLGLRLEESASFFSKKTAGSSEPKPPAVPEK